MCFCNELSICQFQSVGGPSTQAALCLCDDNSGCGNESKCQIGSSCAALLLSSNTPASVHIGMLQWGNVFLSIARKFLDEAAIKGTFSEHQARIESEFDKATDKYKEALSIKADFYDGEMQLGQVDFERAKLTAGFIPQPVR